MAAAMGAQTQFGTASSGAATSQFEYNDLSLRLNESLIDAAGLRGTRSHVSERVRQNTHGPGFTITLQPNSVELDEWLPRIFGGSEAADSFPLAETLPEFDAQFDLISTRLTLVDCKVNRAIFRSGGGRPLDLTMEIEALSFTTSGTAFPSLTISTIGPYIYSDSASGLSVAGSTYQFHEWSLEIFNDLDTERFMNAQTRVSLPERDRVITWTWDGPYGDNSALFGLSSAGVASVATFTLGNRSLAFTSNKVAYPREFPTVPGRDELRLPLVGIARKDGSTLELTTVNDSTG